MLFKKILILVELQGSLQTLLLIHQDQLVNIKTGKVLQLRQMKEKFVLQKPCQQKELQLQSKEVNQNYL